MSGFHSGRGSDLRRGGVGVVSGRMVFGSSTTSQLHASRVRLPDALPSSNMGCRDTGNWSRSTLNQWEFNNPESKRKKRIAKYRVYAAQGKVKANLRRGIRWIKNKCSMLVHGC